MKTKAVLLEKSTGSPRLIVLKWNDPMVSSKGFLLSENC